MSRSRLLIAYAVNWACVLTVTVGPVIALDPLRGFKNYFPGDQLTYAAIAQALAPWHEPITMTGTSYYPSAWYLVIGAVSQVSGLTVWALWTVLGTMLLLTATTIAGATSVRLSGRWWAALLPGAALLTGTFAAVASGGWYWLLDRHAVLWGPFGSAYTLNGEIAGWSIAVIASCLLLLGGTNRIRHANAAVIVAGALIGLLANVHTYAFFAATALAAAWTCVTGLLTARSRRLLISNLVVAAGAFLIAPLLAEALGATAAFGVILIASAPGTLAAIRRRPRTALSALGVAALAAAPQIARTFAGLINQDPFLDYRQASTEALGVPLLATVLVSLPLLLAVTVILLRGGRWHPVQRALPIAILLTLAIMPLNDRWGFNQEPYRFWIVLNAIGLVMAAVLLPSALTTPTRRAIRSASLVFTGVLALVFAISALDIVPWWKQAQQDGLIPLGGDRFTAAHEAVVGASGLVAAGPCLDPRELRIALDQPVVGYNKGLAWPANRRAVDQVVNLGLSGDTDARALRIAGVSVVVLDDACERQWSFPPTDEIVPIRTVRYPGGSITALRVLPR